MGSENKTFSIYKIEFAYILIYSPNYAYQTSKLKFSTSNFDPVT